MKQLRQNLWALEEDGVRSYLIVGQERALLVDTGYGVQDYRNQIACVTDLPVALVITHADVDHVGGNAGFPQRYIHPADLNRVRGLLPEDNGPYQELRDGQSLDLGGTELEVMHCPGHTPGSVMFYNRAERYLISGDSLGSEPIWMFGEQRSPADFRQSILHLRELAAGTETIYPSHGPTPLEDFDGLTADTIAAVDDYLAGKKETGLFRVDYAPDNVFDVRVFAHGRARVMVNLEA